MKLSPNQSLRDLRGLSLVVELSIIRVMGFQVGLINAFNDNSG